MELRHLRYFVAVADHLSFTKAAGTLRVAQPSLSRQVQQLESELGVKLLQRSATNLTLTAAGKIFLGEARAILDRTVKAAETARGANLKLNSRLKIGYAWGLFHSIAPALLANFNTRCAGADVELLDMTAPEQTTALLENRIDIGLIGFKKDASSRDLRITVVAECELQAAIPKNHRLARNRSVDLRDLNEEPFCTISEATFPGAAHAATDACREAGFKPRTVAVAPRGYMMLGLMTSSSAVALMPAPLAALPHPNLVFRPLKKPFVRELCAAWNPKHQSSFRDQFLESFQVAQSKQGA